jgi:hypothetical protein
MRSGKRNIQSQSTPWVNAINSIIHLIPKVSNRLQLNDAQKLMNTASNKIGLDDFGDKRFKEGYDMFIQSLVSEGYFSPLGHYIIKRNILNFLINRLLVQETLRCQPEIRNLSITRPIFIAGLSRTGTTLLHNLLSLAPGARAPRTWELIQPAPACVPGSNDERKRIRKTRRLLMFLHHIAPCFRIIHPISETAVEECYPFINHTFTSPALAIHYGLEEYGNWLKTLSTDHERWVYIEYMSQLKTLQSVHPEHRWVLKSAIHLYFLSSLLKEIPEAVIVQTHRDPKQMIPSICSLVSCFRSLLGVRSEYKSLGLNCLNYVKETLKRGNLARNKNPQAQFIDVQFDELVANPIEQVKKIHEQSGLECNDLHVKRMERWLEVNPAGLHGTHQYSLSQFGLKEEEIFEMLTPEILWNENNY